MLDTNVGMIGVLCLTVGFAGTYYNGPRFLTSFDLEKAKAFITPLSIASGLIALSPTTHLLLLIASTLIAHTIDVDFRKSTQ